MAEYNKHVWTAGEPITPEKVNNMENGIEGAYNLANSALNQNETLGSSISNLENSIQNVNDKIGTGFDASHTIAATVANNYNDLNNRISIINQANASGNLAWGQLLSAGVEYNNATDTVTKTLQDILDTYATVIALNSVNTTLTASLQNAYTTPSPNDTVEVGGETQTVASLAQRIQHIYNTITAVDNKFGDTFTNQLTVSTKFNELNTLLQNLSDSLGNITGVTLGERISALDGGSINSRADLPTRSIKDLITEIGNAHSSTAFASEGSNATYDNLDERFEAGENRIVDIEAEIAGAHHTTATTLDARFDAIDGGGQPSRTLPSVISEIETARDGQNSLHARISAIDNTQNDSSVISRVSALENNKVNTADVYNDLDRTASGKVLDARQGKALNDKIIGVKDEVETARTSSIIKEDDDGVMVDKTYTSLDARLEAIEAHAAGIRSDIDTIAGELDMVDTNGLKTIGTRVDALDAHITTVADELGMVQSGEIVNTNTRIDAIDADLNTANTGIKDRLTAVETKADAAAVASTVNEALTELDTRLDAIDGPVTGTLISRVSTIESTINDNDGLIDRIDALEQTPKSATVIISEDRITYSEPDINNNITPTIYTDNTKQTAIVPTEEVDYLLQKEDKYYYWKYIGTSSNGTWNLISGGGGEGTGNSNSEVYADYTAFQAAEEEENKDYYVFNTQDNIYHHYRYIPTGNPQEPFELIEIGQIINADNIKQYNLTSSTEGENDNKKNYIDLYEFEYGVNNTEFSEGRRIAHIELVGGGGSGTISSRKFTRITAKAINIAKDSNDPLMLRFFYTTGVANESDNYTLTQSSRSVAEHVVEEGTINSGNPSAAATTWPDVTTVGFTEIDISQYCKNAEAEVQTFTLKAYDSDNPDNYTTISWNINIVNLSINSNFTQSSVAALGQTVRFSYIPTGGVEKTATFEINNTIIGSVSLSAKTISEQIYDIAMPESGEGVYQLKAYLTANLSGTTISSDPIYRDLIWRDSNSSNIIIGSPYRGRTVPVIQYDTITIPYSVAGNLNSYHVQFFVDDMNNPINETILMNSNGGNWNYKPLVTGNHTVKIQVEDVSLTFILAVSDIGIDIKPVETDLILDFNPQGLNNNSNAARNWTNGIYHLTTSSNFDWYNGGYGSDADGEYFLVKSGTRAYIDYKMFKAGTESITDGNTTVTTTTSAIYGTGQEMKIIFKTSAVRSIDAVWFNNTARYDSGVDKEVGIQLGTHSGWLKTDTAGMVVEDNEAITNTYLYFPYSEDDRIELDININKEDPVAKEGNFIMSYEDGVPSKAYAYTHGQKLYHAENQEAIITIGSDDCDTYIYRLRIYNNELSGAQILRNFIADGKDIDECITRYNRNCIYYDSDNNEYSPYADDNFVLDPEALAVKIPNVKVLMLDAPNFTKNKKTFVKDSSLRCIHAPGGTKFVSRGAADNWKFENGYHSGQGTTSDKYGDAGRNLDFIFNCDGSHKPTDKVDPINGYVSQVTTGYGTQQAQVSAVTDWKGDSGKISLTSTSVPNNFFNFKVNIASSENVNNALLQKRYNDFLPYVSPASANQHAKHPGYDSSVVIKNDMEFVPAVLFLRERNNEISTHLEFKDTDWHFYALGNLGDSKKTDYTRAYDPDDMNEFTIEISDNNTNNSQFQTGVYMLNGQEKLEDFHPQQDLDDENKPIAGSFTAVGDSGAIATTDYIYPVSKAQWNAWDDENNRYANKAHWALVNEKYDGDHSFEMRYACCGDYRDGKKVNDTTGQASAQLDKNSKVWQAFYSWVVTANNEEFVQDLDQWCVRSAVEFWYAFTHYYTMMDSRAKNTFWHFAKTGIHRRVKEPLKDLLHTYDESDNAIQNDNGTYSGTFTRTSDTEIDSGKVYYTEYAFDMWDYDNDTALGINNNGELIFPYGKEDTDYTIDNTPESGFVFNGAGSVFWNRLRDLCTSEISSIFTTVNENFFSAENLIESFDAFQECYPEALWQIDIQRKYIRPFTGESLDNSKERDNQVFLKSMMQGRKKYQRRQWIKDQYYYFGSKYKLGNVTEDFFLLDCYKGPDDALIAELKAQGRDEEAAQYVGSNWDITITPYQDMYINASFGETAKAPVRAKAGQPVEMTSPFTDMNNTRIYIYGASRIQALAGKAIREDPNDSNSRIIGADGLAPLYLGLNQLQRTEKLRNLNLGTDKPTYRNTNFNELKLNKENPILETLNIKNCGSLVGELDLSKSDNLRVLEAEGTSYTNILLPSSSQITTLHLPSTIASLTLRSARLLDDLSIKNKETGLQDYSNIREMLIDNSDYSSNINWLNISSGILDNLNYLYLLNLNNSSVNNISELEIFKEKRNSLSNANLLQLSGTIHVLGNWSQVEKDSYGGLPTSVWPDLNIDTTSGSEQIKCKVVYMESGYQSDTGYVPAREIETRYISSNGTDSERIIPDIYTGSPSNGFYSRPSTISTVYQFGSIEQDSYRMYSGWSLSQGNDAQPLSNTYSAFNPYRANTFVSEIILYTYYNTTPHTYSVKWYLGDTVVKTVNNQSYGDGYNLEAPTVKELRTAGYETAKVTFNTNGTATYKIFDGWQKLPTNITPSIEEAQTSIYRIDAKWHEETVQLTGTNGLFSNVSSPTLEQLFVLSRMDTNLRGTVPGSQNIVPTLKYSYQMGFEGTKKDTGINILNTTSARRFPDSNNIYGDQTNGIQPFSSNDGFTLVLDYQFDNTQTVRGTANILVGCYGRNNGNVTGFALYNYKNNSLSTNEIRVGYGDMFNESTKSVALHNPNQRNIVVLRHPKGSAQLWIYSSAGSGNVTSTTLTIPTPINVNTQVTNDAIICLGNLRNDLISNNTYTWEANNLGGAQGTIYWARYWNEDLGAGECKQLAAWPHERMEAIIAAIDSDKTNDTLTRPSIYLTNLTVSNHAFVLPTRFNQSQGTIEGWNNSAAKTICDSRLLPGLPIRLQSILGHPNIGYRNYTAVEDPTYLSTVYVLSGMESTDAFVYSPSVSSLRLNATQYSGESILERTGSALNDTSDITPYTWIGDTSSMSVYIYDSSEESGWRAGEKNTNYYNIRFINKPYSWSSSNNMRVFYIPANTLINTSIYNAIGSANIQANDIVIIENDAAYIYVTPSEYNTYGIFTEAQGETNSLFNTNNQGGWLQATAYTTRSVSYGSTNCNFIYVNKRGEIVVPESSGQQPANAVGVLGLDFAFTI